eukprot:5888499-Lingulodinium_polyedra.AAC.1
MYGCRPFQRATGEDPEHPGTRESQNEGTRRLRTLGPCIAGGRMRTLTLATAGFPNCLESPLHHGHIIGHYRPTTV